MKIKVNGYKPNSNTALPGRNYEDSTLQSAYDNYINEFPDVVSIRIKINTISKDEDS